MSPSPTHRSTSAPTSRGPPRGPPPASGEAGSGQPTAAALSHARSARRRGIGPCHFGAFVFRGRKRTGQRADGIRPLSPEHDARRAAPSPRRSPPRPLERLAVELRLRARRASECMADPPGNSLAGASGSYRVGAADVCAIHALRALVKLFGGRGRPSADGSPEEHLKASPEHPNRLSRRALRSDDTDARKATVARVGRSDRSAQHKGLHAVDRRATDRMPDEIDRGRLAAGVPRSGASHQGPTLVAAALGLVSLLEHSPDCQTVTLI
jgi:hypothetical protein